MLSVTFRSDPLATSLVGDDDARYGILRDSRIVVVRCPTEKLLERLFHEKGVYKQAIVQGKRVAQVAVMDYLLRTFTTQVHTDDSRQNSHKLTMERIDLRCASQQQQYHHHRRHHNHARMGRRRVLPEATLPPYLLERTDMGWTQDEFTWYLRVALWQSHKEIQMNGQSSTTIESSFQDMEEQYLMDRVVRVMDAFLSSRDVTALLTHAAVAVCQDRLRTALIEADGVAFVAKSSILPRKSGVSQAPMSSPPAIPFEAPPDSPKLNRTLTVDMGLLRPFIDLAGTTGGDAMDTSSESTTLTLEGLFIPSGITLICGGGYHGKSTLLRCIAAGVYNKIPGDGREYSVTRTDALSVRAEDGRYVQNCNISAFISNLPSLPGTQSSVDTAHFSTNEASGSTSQAANVIEALELGCKAMLVDEDVSAANFMARDGRMRALVMDESITPLLYRVNGLYGTHGVSSIVVVGGVGDWLDVPHNVVLMNKYRCTDATAKAKSVSKQFSHGHVQYAGRGTVHRLPWDATGTPIPRRPTNLFCQGHDFTNRHVALLDGGHGLALHKVYSKEDDSSDSSVDEGDDEDAWIDMSRCEQLLGRKPQLYGCGLALLSLCRLARQNPKKGLAELLREWDALVDQKGLFSQLQTDDATWESTVATLGAVLRPRGLEIGQALCRLRGIRFEELPIEDDGAEAAARAEEERKKKELLEMWNNRRKKERRFD